MTPDDRVMMDEFPRWLAAVWEPDPVEEMRRERLQLIRERHQAFLKRKREKAHAD